VAVSSLQTDPVGACVVESSRSLWAVLGQTGSIYCSGMCVVWIGLPWRTHLCPRVLLLHRNEQRMSTICVRHIFKASVIADCSNSDSDSRPPNVPTHCPILHVITGKGVAAPCAVGRCRSTSLRMFVGTAVRAGQQCNVGKPISRRKSVTSDAQAPASLDLAETFTSKSSRGSQCCKLGVCCHSTTCCMPTQECNRQEAEHLA
jgi:hypothetical protein